MKKIIIIMLVLMAVGLAFGFDNGFTVNNRSSKYLSIGYRTPGGSYMNIVYLSPGTAVYYPGWSTVTYEITAVVGHNFYLRIPGYYESQTHTLEWGAGQDNVVDFYFSHLDPLDPGNPGQNQ